MIFVNYTYCILDINALIYTGDEKAFKCNICNKRVKHKSTLKKHKRTHSLV